MTKNRKMVPPFKIDGYETISIDDDKDDISTDFHGDAY